MEMKLNTQLLVESRNRKAWSQQQLADESGLSLRTVQRIENTGKASPDSTKVLATALGKATQDLMFQGGTSKLIASNINKKIAKSIVFSSIFIGAVLLIVSNRITADSGQFNFSGVVKIDDGPNHVFGIQMANKHTQLIDIDLDYQLLFITPDVNHPASKTELRILKKIGASSKILRRATVTGSNSNIRYFSYQICSENITFYNHYKTDFRKCNRNEE